MITNITLENFKCFRKVEVNPRRITAFVGPNGTGKSSVLQALALLKQSVGKSGLRHEGNLVSLGHPENVTPNFISSVSLVHIEFGGTHHLSTHPAAGFDQDISYNYAATFLRETPLHSQSGKIDFAFEGQKYTIQAPKDTEPHNFQFGNYLANIEPPSLEIARLAILSGWRRDSPPDVPTQETFREILATPNNALRALRFVHAARGLVQPIYRLGPSLMGDISLSGGLTLQEEFTATNLAYTRPLENKISSLMERVTGVGLRADMVPRQSVEVKALTKSHKEVNLVAEGFGTNSLIQLFWQLASANKGATVLIEEPEIHLHPKAQAELASVLVEEGQAEDKQIIMTTHSEHIVGRLLTLVAENKLSAEELAIYAFEKDGKGECSAQQLEVTEVGKVVGGIKDFFESDLDELERYINALKANE